MSLVLASNHGNGTEGQRHREMPSLQDSIRPGQNHYGEGGPERVRWKLLNADKTDHRTHIEHNVFFFFALFECRADTRCYPPQLRGPHVVCDPCAFAVDNSMLRLYLTDLRRRSDRQSRHRERRKQVVAAGEEASAVPSFSRR